MLYNKAKEEIKMTDEELLNKMNELDGKFKSMRKLAFKVASEMDKLTEEYAGLLKEAKDRKLVE